MNVSVIICTYNPEERIFKRCLNAIQNFNTQNLQVEVLLVDNNSSTDLQNIPYIKQFLNNCTHAKYLVENKAGLTNARICGYQNATAPILVFFDDDNEPHKNYLQVAHQILTSKLNVGMIGPGKIEVDFIDGSNKWLEKRRPLFQQINLSEAKYEADVSTYHHFYPYGTGLVVTKSVMKNYVEAIVNNGKISDRNGDSLISGGDVQIVWSGVKMGFAAGRNPMLSLNHIIPKNRTTEKYVKKLNYFTSFSSTMTYLGVFPEKEQEIKKSKTTFLKLYYILIKCSIRNIFNQKTLNTEFIPSILGKTGGYYFAFKKQKPQWLAKTESFFGCSY
jgi:glycosyltransferase involved in cell wall biosynthesis